MKHKKELPEETAFLAYEKVKERKRWQMAFRRYVVEGIANENNAPFFGLEIAVLKKWFELQFDETLNWENFGINWQFEHILPIAYFDFSNEDDLKLCWNYINIRVDSFQPNASRGSKIDVLAVKVYFEKLYKQTNFSIVAKMVEKINQIELANIESNEAIEDYINLNKQKLEKIATLSNNEFNKLNQGILLEDILLERELLKKFGS